MLAIRKRFLVILLACAWLVAAAGGLRVLWGYATRAGEAGAAPSDWPAATTLPRGDMPMTLVMFVHPMCPCSRASADELARLMARCNGAASVNVVAVEPLHAPQDWAQSELLQTLRGIPGVKVVSDSGGVEARRFGARTSGHTMLFDERGRLLFSGGITAARGHAGDNAGSDNIIALVNHQRVDATQKATAVFGCSLFGETLTAQEGIN